MNMFFVIDKITKTKIITSVNDHLELLRVKNKNYDKAILNSGVRESSKNKIPSKKN
jgi:peptidyl-tRNA hydrolase